MSVVPVVKEYPKKMYLTHFVYAKVDKVTTYSNVYTQSFRFSGIFSD